MVMISRRHMLAGAAFVAGAATTAAADAGLSRRAQRQLLKFGATPSFVDGVPDWASFKALFPIESNWIDMSAMLLTSHPAPVATAIKRYRARLDHNPSVYLGADHSATTAAREAAAQYLGGLDGESIALTDSTTMGIALIYAGLRLKAGQEILTTTHDYYVTHESLRLAALRSGAPVRHISLYDPDERAKLTTELLTERIIREIRRETRVLALTWVHSSTGLKLPLREIGAALARINAEREEEDRVLFCVDAVHGFGNQADSFTDLGCDFLASGCHKWMFGPRGTGIVAGSASGWRAVMPTIPSFIDPGTYGRWRRNEPSVPFETTAASFTPGGFKAFEHIWSLPVAFALHTAIGKDRIAERTAELATQLKEGLRSMPRIVMHTPVPPALSAGIVAFDVEGQSPRAVVSYLHSHKIAASVAPYHTQQVRLTPSIRNDPAEIDIVLKRLREMPS
jgi:isopenicillin-N epimerase